MMMMAAGNRARGTFPTGLGCAAYTTTSPTANVNTGAYSRVAARLRLLAEPQPLANRRNQAVHGGDSTSRRCAPPAEVPAGSGTSRSACARVRDGPPPTALGLPAPEQASRLVFGAQRVSLREC